MKITALANVGTKISTFAGRAGLKLQKHSPEILLAAGIVGFVGTVVLGCRATLKADAILNQYEEEMKKNEQAQALGAVKPETYDYSENDYDNDQNILKLKTAGNFLKLYAPTIALGGLSVACLITSRNITNKRYLAATAAYTALSEAFQEYRNRVVDECGEKMDRHYRYGTTYSTITEEDINEEGKKVKTKVDVEETSLSAPSDTARFFDSSNRNHDDNPTFSLMFLRAQEQRLNDLLQSRGHVFLNEVYDALGFEHTAQGQVLGWINEKDRKSYISFGLYRSHDENVRRFINGNENSILLDFNVDGVIWDKI